MAAHSSSPPAPEPQLRGDRVYEQLLKLLDTTARNERLPGELELARRFDVSRPVLRQALARLRAEGRIHSRKGSGHYAGERFPAVIDLRFGSLTSVPDIQSMLEFRLTLEAECAACAAVRSDAAERREIRSRRRQFERAVATGAPGIDEDIAFHEAIARASHNRFLIATLAAIVEQARFGIRLVRDLSARPMAHRLAEVCREHAAIEEAIGQGDPVAARAAVTAHHSRGIQRLFGK